MTRYGVIRVTETDSPRVAWWDTTNNRAEALTAVPLRRHGPRRRNLARAERAMLALPLGVDR